ncbi:alpha/beta hydrolase fold domain-containing protein [Luteimonas sp. TWI1437]|uniref:alpha/beta hydrolase n=1 Tax=unclassified Luteimonas TaxID=2629088 RepID=UPI003208257D
MVHPEGVHGRADDAVLPRGGYTFHAAVTRNFIAMLAHRLQVRIFSLEYRMTPEHAHPAQLDDALSAYRRLVTTGIAPSDLILCGDSAGGHLVLMTLAALRAAELPQPLLAIAISPWTYIGRLGESQFGNDRYDMVQGYQTLQYGKWLKGGADYTDAALSPMGQDFGGTAPLYIQADDKEILVDMIRAFAKQAVGQGAGVRLDVWAHMTHEFHAYGDTEPASRHAIARMRQAMDWAVAQRRADGARPHGDTTQDHAFAEAGQTGGGLFPAVDETEVDAWPDARSTAPAK